jgi:urocanate hydratase
LYWVTTADHAEDWFIFAESARQARAYHEHYEGYGKGDAHSRLIVSDVTLNKFMNGTPPCHAQFQDLFQIGFQNAGATPNRRGIKFNSEIFREGILEAIIELGRKQLASEAASPTAELDGMETGPRLVP